ncbi:hypothetical protein H2199_002916 [Coniosporium tulheliwenetii]|uniref:Uncharacterized protein n=1 Tax=Coniosporium tulheliwenetii TaxID=3383036 RepID=A0ACC2ZF44_9PEZI|nr:hypothetical protein H2199_002916 [Cladosporium sp. JES 115]
MSLRLKSGNFASDDHINKKLKQAQSNTPKTPATATTMPGSMNTNSPVQTSITENSAPPLAFSRSQGASPTVTSPEIQALQSRMQNLEKENDRLTARNNVMEQQRDGRRSRQAPKKKRKVQEYVPGPRTLVNDFSTPTPTPTITSTITSVRRSPSPRLTAAPTFICPEASLSGAPDRQIRILQAENDRLSNRVESLEDQLRALEKRVKELERAAH